MLDNIFFVINLEVSNIVRIFATRDERGRLSPRILHLSSGISVFQGCPKLFLRVIKQATEFAIIIHIEHTR